MSGSRTIEETYKKLSQREHILHRPNMYIGDTKKTLEEMWIFNKNINKMQKRIVEYTPAFLKIFDEVLTNALDHSNRDTTVSIIKVDYNTETGEIIVFNNGTGIPVIEHKEQHIYVPELIFGHLLSGSNYDDKQKRIGAGVNGLGVKLSNIYSKKLEIETIDSERNLRFVQEFSDNMENKSKPKVTKNSGKSFTKITFIPDYKKFNMNGLEKDAITLIDKRVYDCIACTNKNVSVFLNGEKIKGKGLVDYANYFFNTQKDGELVKMYYDSFIQKDMIWEFIIVPNDEYTQISFVNGNSTYVGGKHVDHIIYQITTKLKTLLESKKKLKDVKPAMIKERLFLFLRATVVNPQFSSQTKEQLTTQSKDFGCKIEVSDKFIDKLWKSSIIEEIVQTYKLKESMDLAKKTDGSKKNKVYIPKLEDALWAGTARSSECSLILTEGLSAMTFAMWGRSIVGPERYGCWPLKGKVLNIRDASISQLANNEEINNLKQILGLKQGKEYSDTNDLRYNKVMILTDSDVDGSHIKALLINFFHYWWPSLAKLDFIQTIRTPIVKAIRGKKIIEFFTEQDYHKWKNINDISNYQIRYFKGLGTSKKEDAQDTFRRMDELKIDYFYKDKKCDESIELAFEKDKNIAKCKGKSEEVESTDGDGDGDRDGDRDGDLGEKQIVKCSDKRKRWLAQYDKNSYIDVTEKRVSYTDLIHKELVHFSIYDNLRSIPSICDGLKPSQRKILHYMLKKNITKVVKVAQLSGYVSAETGYHHGEASLQGAIINMAQDFVGSNNINLLYPDGNFGCLDPNTEILLWDGSIKKANEIIIGDKLIGDDGKIRTVLKTTKGEDIMYKIITNKNKSYIVNSKHILTLKYTPNKKIYWKESSKSWNVAYFDIIKMKECYKQFMTKESSNIKNTYNKCLLSKEEAYEKIINFVNNIKDSSDNGIFDIKVEDFLKLPKSTKDNFYSINNSSCIDWNHKDLQIDPYILGSWLGDGNSKGSGLTSIDEEVPINYIINSKENRLKLLAGLIDTDGTVKYQNNYCQIEISQSKRLRHHLIKTIQFLCHTLGFKTSISINKNQGILTKKGEDMTMSSLLIYGKNLHEIPTKIFRKQIKNYELNRDSYIESFKIECIGKGKFCGWQLDGNERFIMNNFIVTHNSRLLSGKDAASPRYIYTRLSDITTKIFDKKDSNILSYLEDDGLSIEPEWFLPVIPMVLVNGCEGIGTGYSTYIPPFNPKDIFSNLLRVLDDLEPLPMTPYFKNFNGILESIENGSFITKGKWERTGESQIKITELPVGTAVTTYKEFLESLIEGASDKIKNTTKSKSKPKSIHLKDVKNKTKDENSEICFIIDFKNSHELDDLLKKNELEKLLKLSKTFGTNNMYLFSENLILTKYKNANDILLDFFDIRLEYYEKRKSFLIKRLTNQLTLLNSKVRFINEYIDGSLDINRKSKDYIVKLLEENKYPKLSFNIDTDDTDDTQDKEKSYDYLVKMQLVSLSLEKIKELQNQTDSKQAELGILQSKTHKDLWKDDLHSILKLTHI